MRTLGAVNDGKEKIIDDEKKITAAITAGPSVIHINGDWIV
jgi:hypothetical protein